MSVDLSLNANIRAAWQKAGSGFNPREAILLLWDSFPSLTAGGACPEEWQPLEIEHCLEKGDFDNSAAWCAAFVLSVWNPQRFKFDLQPNLEKLEIDDRAAFADWCLHPWWP